MSNAPPVSVVIPCFNAARFIDETLESVAAQTFPDWEVIVVDDGSTDDSRSVIERWRLRLGERMRAHFGPNRGASAARNTGTRMALGQFVQYLDADDLLRPDTLEKRVAALADAGDVAYCDWQKLEESEDGRFVKGEVVSRRIEDVHARPEIALFTSFWAPPAALLYRRTVVDAIGAWNESLPIVQDARFALDAALAGARFVYVPGVGTDYRVPRSASLSRRDPVRFVKDCYVNACQIEEYWQTHGGLDGDRRMALAECYGYTARTFLQADYAMFKENLRKLYRVEPGFRPTYPKIAGLLASLFGKGAAVRTLNALQRLRKSGG